MGGRWGRWSAQELGGRGGVRILHASAPRLSTSFGAPREWSAQHSPPSTPAWISVLFPSSGKAQPGQAASAGHSLQEPGDGGFPLRGPEHRPGTKRTGPGPGTRQRGAQGLCSHLRTAQPFRGARLRWCLWLGPPPCPHRMPSVPPTGHRRASWGQEAVGTRDHRARVVGTPGWTGNGTLVNTD